MALHESGHVQSTSYLIPDLFHAGALLYLDRTDDARRGFFRPMEGANPSEGKVGEINEVAEYKLEVNCKRELVKEAIEVIKRVHPYEEPLINVIPLVNHIFDEET
jgi:hypothetical protein